MVAIFFFGAVINGMALNARHINTDGLCPVSNIVVQGTPKENSTGTTTQIPHEATQWGVDPAVDIGDAPTETTDPLPGPVVADPGSDPRACSIQASKVLNFWNNHREFSVALDGNEAEYLAEFGDQKGHWQLFNTLASTLIDDYLASATNLPKGNLENNLPSSVFSAPRARIYWVYNSDRARAPYASSCVFTFECGEIDTDETTAVTGIVDYDVANSGAYTNFNNLCFTPFAGPCAANEMTQQPSAECFPMNENGADQVGVFCRDAYDTLLTDASKSTKVIEVCDAYPDIDACSCLERNNPAQPSNVTYADMKNSAFQAASDNCWFLPCKLDGLDRLRTPSQIDGANNCTGTFCQNLIEISDSQDIDLEGVEQYVNCSQEELDAINSNQRRSTDGGGVFDDLDGEGLAWYVWAAVAVAVIAIAVLLYRRLTRKKKKKKK